MTRESASDKARRLLDQGRIIVTEVDTHRRTVRATARGEGHMYALAYAPRWGWSCTCPVRSDQCAHLRALRRVVAVDLDNGGAP